MKSLLLFLLLLPITALAQSDRNCGYDGAVERAYLSCVACGIKDVVGRTPSFKYLSLLAVTTNQYSELDPTTRRAKNNNIAANLDAREEFYRRMSEQIQAYGFCLDEKITPEGNTTGQKGYGHLTRDEWQMITPYIASHPKASRSAMKDVARQFGFTTADDMKTLLSQENWVQLTVQQRQQNFRQGLHLALQPNLQSSETQQEAMIRHGDKFGDGLEDCLKQINLLQTRKDSAFNYQEKIQTEKSNLICKSISRSCGLTDVKHCDGPRSFPLANTGAKSSPTQGKSSPSQEPAFNLFENVKGAR